MWCVILYLTCIMCNVSSYSMRSSHLSKRELEENIVLLYYLTHDNAETRQIVIEQRSLLQEVGADNVYLLYTRENMDAQIIKYNDLRSIKNSYFDAAKVTVVLIHGFLNNRHSNVNTMLTKAFLQDGDVNVIVVDWTHAMIVSWYKFYQKYLKSVAAVPNVGKYVGKFIAWLSTAPINVSFDKVHVVGHSLGAHVAGHAGKETGGRIRRITALDPAGPFFDHSTERIVETDAQYVEVIHTNTDVFGYKHPCGYADFYPNGGACMPECGLKLTCSHSKSYEYMAQSVKYNNLIAHECRTMDDVNKGTCEGYSNPMGNSDLGKHKSGLFRVDTDAAKNTTNLCRSTKFFDDEIKKLKYFKDLLNDIMLHLFSAATSLQTAEKSELRFNKARHSPS